MHYARNEGSPERVEPYAIMRERVPWKASPSRLPLLCLILHYMSSLPGVPLIAYILKE